MEKKQQDGEQQDLEKDHVQYLLRKVNGREICVHGIQHVW